MRLRLALLLGPLLVTTTAHAQQPDSVSRYIRVPRAPMIVLEHVRVIDGTGAAPLEDQYVVIAHGKIAAISAKPLPGVPGNAVHLDLTGRTVFPGIVGMHDHLYNIARPNFQENGAYEPPLVVPEMPFSSPHLYLGAGVTTMRTTGSVEPYADLNLRVEIDAGRIPGPHMDVTAPYLEGPSTLFMQMHHLRDAAEARAMVGYWISVGATSFKAYMNITRAELKAAIDEAHAHGLKITGHLCSVTYPEAAELGIDDLEHGFVVNTQLDPGKTPDQCPASDGIPTLVKMAPGSDEAKSLIALLIAHHVAVTSTLPVFQSMDPTHYTPPQRVLDAMSPPARADYLAIRRFELGRVKTNPQRATQHALALQNEMGLEREFVSSGGMLLAGPDPTGDGGVLPGYGDQQEIELLVKAGFTPLEALRIATLNGAIYLGRDKTIGSIAVGKNADMVVVKGDPSKKIDDIENTEIVFKDGVGYDSQKLLGSVKGRYGQY